MRTAEGQSRNVSRYEGRILTRDAALNERHAFLEEKMRNAFMTVAVSLLLAGCASVNLDGDIPSACTAPPTDAAANPSTLATSSARSKIYSKPNPKILSDNISPKSIAAGFSGRRDLAPANYQ